MTANYYAVQPDIVRGIPADRWIHRDLCDIARMTDKQRMAYWIAMSTASAKLLMTKGNLVGEKPEKPLNIATMVRQHEAAHQRAMAYQMEVFQEDERADRLRRTEQVGGIPRVPSDISY